MLRVITKNENAPDEYEKYEDSTQLILINDVILISGKDQSDID